MRFGISVYPFSRFSDPSEMLDVVQTAERLGYYAIIAPEHILPPQTKNLSEHSISRQIWFDLSVLFSYFAAATRQIKLMTCVTVLPYHHPIELAKSLATVDVLSHGRLLVGIGTGWWQEEFSRLGIPFEERAAITDDYLKALKTLWTADMPAYVGKYISFPAGPFEPHPVQRPHPPLLIGGSGRRALQRVVTLGDGWLPMAGTAEALRQGIDWICQEMSKRGRDPTKLFFGRVAGFAISLDQEVARQAAHVRGEHIRNSSIDRLSTQQAHDQIGQYHDVGVNFLSVDFAWRNAKELKEEMAWFASEVMPAWSAR